MIANAALVRPDFGASEPTGRFPAMHANTRTPARDDAAHGNEPLPLERRSERAIFLIFVEAAAALIAQLVEVGIADHADIARRLNRRGFPCWGRPRWTAGAVAMVMRQKARLDERC